MNLLAFSDVFFIIILFDVVVVVVTLLNSTFFQLISHFLCNERVLCKGNSSNHH